MENGIYVGRDSSACLKQNEIGVCATIVFLLAGGRPVKSGETVTYDSRTRIPDGNTVVEAGGTLIFRRQCSKIITYYTTLACDYYMR